MIAYWMPITLWSCEKTYFHRNPSSSWAWSCACSARWFAGGRHMFQRRLLSRESIAIVRIRR